MHLLYTENDVSSSLTPGTNLFGVWRSPVAHLVWDQGVQGSNPCTPTKIYFSSLAKMYRQSIIDQL